MHQGEDVSDAFRVAPDCAISWEVTNHACAGYSGIAVNIHGCGRLGDILEHRCIVENVVCGLIIQ